jgi:pimeloyl-ACP methyl ester carboxylesterase
MVLIPIFTAIGLGLFFLIADGMCTRSVKKAKKRLETYKHKEIQLNSGTVTYLDRGKGKDGVILSIHGIVGGYDQAFETARPLLQTHRVIAPSRFGYLGSEMPADPSPKEQAKVFADLLDALEVEQVYLLAASTGGTVAIRFALDYPERTKGLILYSSAAPFAEKPKHPPKYVGPPSGACNNLGMFLFSLYFKPVLGIEREEIYTMLPINEKRRGIINDATVTHQDMAKNYEEYVIEDISAPSLVFHAKNDKMSKFKLMEKGVRRFSDCKFVEFEKGGHMLEGCGKEIGEELKTYFEKISETYEKTTEKDEKTTESDENI